MDLAKVEDFIQKDLSENSRIQKLLLTLHFFSTAEREEIQRILNGALSDIATGKKLYRMVKGGFGSFSGRNGEHNLNPNLRR